jgi:SAM-dependent methyltransferase
LLGKPFAFCALMEQVADPQPVACKICDTPSPLYGVVDFHKSCIEAQQRRLTLSGYPIYFRRCPNCGFAFTTAFDQWTGEEYKERIYNADYVLVDPDFVDTRPRQNAELIRKTFAASRESIEILDYGGGSGLMADLLVKNGFRAATFDPFSEHNQRPRGRFQLITCFEVLEHVPFPHQTAADMNVLLADGGAILFSTLVQPEPFDSIGLSWWYAGPRNGHISLYTPSALAILFARFSLRVISFSQGLHMAYGRVPEFARHLNLPD